MSSRRRYQTYRNLWLDSGHEPDTQKGSKGELVSDFCDLLDGQTKLEDYVVLLCERMEEFLSSSLIVNELKRSPELKKKLSQFGSKIIKNSYGESDLMYLGIFIELEMGAKMWDSRFYKIIKSLFIKILDCGHHISRLMRQKLKKLLKLHNRNVYTQIFLKYEAIKPTG